MYNTHIPVMVTGETFSAEAVLKDLEKCGVNRVFLAIPPLTTDEGKQAEIFEKLAKALAFFKQKGLEVGVWFWAFWVDGDKDFTPITGIHGDKCDVNCCPTDEKFLSFFKGRLTAIAKMSPDLIQFDDDLRFGFLSCGFGCTCQNHRRRMEETLGEKLPDGDLFSLFFGGKPNQYRRAFLKANGDSLRHFAHFARDVVDKVNPDIRMGQCACLSSFDLDGADAFEISRILAGNTKPFLRLIGAPYWANKKSWGNRLEDVIELERLERSWYEGDDMEIYAEGDVYPRPRFYTPASYLELFDAALRADGTLDGILKYMLDYTASANYERGYLNRHIADEPNKRTLIAQFQGKKATGIRVYQSMRTVEDADFTLCPDNSEKLVRYRFLPVSARMLATNAFPTTYRGNGCAGIAFGENARHLPDSAFEKPLIVDILGARILSACGHDVGLTHVGERKSPKTEHFPKIKETVAIYNTCPCTYALALKEKAVVHGEFEEENGEKYPYCYTYENDKGEKYIVYNFDSDCATEDIWRSYAHTELLHDLLAKWGCDTPVKCVGNPDLYILCKDDEDSRSILYCNCFADAVAPLTVTLDEDFVEANCFRFEGTLQGKTLTIPYLPAFEYTFVTLKRGKTMKKELKQETLENVTGGNDIDATKLYDGANIVGYANANDTEGLFNVKTYKDAGIGGGKDSEGLLTKLKQ